MLLFELAIRALGRTVDAISSRPLAPLVARRVGGRGVPGRVGGAHRSVLHRVRTEMLGHSATWS